MALEWHPEVPRPPPYLQIAAADPKDLGLRAQLVTISLFGTIVSSEAPDSADFVGHS